MAARCSARPAARATRRIRCCRRSVALTPEHYNRIARLMEQKIPVKLEFDIEARMLPRPEMRSTWSPRSPARPKKDEIVMLGAHLDRWHGGTGATDNAAGCAVAMEAMRILKSLRSQDGPHRAHRVSGAAKRKDCSARALREGALRRSAKR